MNLIEVDGARCFQAMVPMRDGARMNTFVFLPPSARPGNRFPVIVQRTPYGITSPVPAGEPLAPGGGGPATLTDPTRGWLPDPAQPLRGSMLRGWRAITAAGYAAVYQDCRGRNGSEGEDHVYGDDAADGFDTLEWIASEPWSNGRVGLSGSSAGATTALAAASTRHPSVQAFFAQVGGSSIYDDVVYEGNSIELERLWLWVANNIPGLSASHREVVKARSGLSDAELDVVAARARARYGALDGARHQRPPYLDCPEWMHLPLLGYPEFSVWQPYLDELISHPAPDAFRAAHSFRATIDVPGFHATTWFDIFLTSVLAAFGEIQARVGNQRLWIGPNDHYFVYETQYWTRDPWFEWFGLWLKDEPVPIATEPAVHYSPRCWVSDPAAYVPDDWRHADTWPPPGVTPQRWWLQADGGLVASGSAGDGGPAAPGGPDGTRSFRYDPAHPIPSLGGRNMLITAGSRDQRPVRDQPDYGLVYASAPLEAELTIAGPVTATVQLASDRPDTDVVVKLVEHRTDGRAMLLMDGVTRALFRHGRPDPRPLVVGTVHEIRVDLGHIHHTFAAGSRIEVDVTSSNFPRRARNTNSGNPLLAADGPDAVHVAINTVHHGAAHPSSIELPVLA
ncbi:MAG: CocE/NonD family hydrolase [Acidimicrobiia bacterium]|nr:CocE/NonD family hydrolase [Acidimicrobiia bacterium]